MLLILGGAFSGKRKYVRVRIPSHSLLSAYENHNWDHWKEQWKGDTDLVVEGWEQWVEEQLKSGKEGQEVVAFFYEFMDQLIEKEKQSGKKVAFIMLEVGKGIVPMSKMERDLRDMVGWITQHAAKKAEEVIYIWHGQVKRIHKRI